MSALVEMVGGLVLGFAFLGAAFFLVRRLRPVEEVEPAIEAEEGDADERTLAALAAAGSDLGKPTEVIFYLYFPSAGHAESAAHVARREEYRAEVRPPSAGDSEWLCVLSRTMLPALQPIRAARARLEDLAGSLGGELDGWEAAVVP